MSGHSKWSTIKHKKGAKDAQRSKLWGRLIREVTIAARGGGDPEANPRLRLAVSSARAANMPKDTIEKAIKRGSGGMDGVVYEEISYEGYGPGGVAVFVDTQTDNRNRTAAEVRHVFTKYNGNLGSTGCVGYLFERKGLILIDAEATDIDTVMEAAIEAGAEDVEEENGSLVVTASFSDYAKVLQALQDSGMPITSSELTRIATTETKVAGKDAETLMKLINALDDLDDVSAVSANFDIDDEELAAIEENI